MPDATLPSALRIRAALPHEAPALAALGERLFREAYGPTHPEPELSRYVARTYTAQGFADAIADDGSAVLVADAEAGDASRFAGYALLRAGPPPAPITPSGAHPVEVVRFYVDARWHGRGVAQALMEGCVAHARARGADLLWLQAWTRAPQALAFYRKAGFSIVGDAIFEFGDRRDADFLLARAVIRDP